MISVLVTGATSAVGERLVRSLIADTRVRHVLAADAAPADRALPFTHQKRLTYVQVDLTKPREVRELLFGAAKELKCEAVVHLASEDSPFNKGRRARQLNVEALRSVLELADRHPTIGRLVVRSYAEVYRVGIELPVLVTEDHPLNMDPTAPQFVRDRVEADLTACARMGLIDCEIVVLRCAEALGPGTGSQLFDYLDAPVALRPAGYDPMVNVATVADIVRALELATHGSGEGVFNIPGYDTLPLSECIWKWGTPSIPLPASAIGPLYTLRHRVTGSTFRFGTNSRRMHFGLVLDGGRAHHELGYVPQHPVDWPQGGQVGG